MTIEDISNLPILTVNLYPRVSDLTNLNAYIYNKETRNEYVVGIPNISYANFIATITLTDAELISDLSENSALSIIFYIETSGSTYENSVPVYRDLITFKDSSNEFLFTV